MGLFLRSDVIVCVTHEESEIFSHRGKSFAYSSTYVSYANLTYIFLIKSYV